jgi:hypothetical protein
VGGRAGLDALDGYGGGDRHPVTGLYEFYEDLPPEFSAVSESDDGPLEWLTILEQWPLVEGGFHAVYGVDLVAVWDTVDWRWFRTRLGYLLVSETPLARYFTRKPEGG